MDKDRDFLINGIRNGFRITSNPINDNPVFCKNYKSATDPTNAPDVEAQILTELDNGHYITCKTPPSIVSSLGAIRKSSGSIRLIHDCSRPHGAGLNSYAVTSKFKYETVDRAVELLPMKGYMAKVDLSSAYRVVPIHPDDYMATGLHWTFAGDTYPTFLIDTRLPFGASKSPEIFQRLSNSVTRMMAERGFTCISYLDDFLVIEQDKQQCTKGYKTLLKLLQELGFIINWDKVALPAQQVTFLGIDIDSVSRQLSLPQHKLQEMRSLLHSWTHKKKATKKELQQLVGKLNWAARVVRGGRTFLRRIIDIMCSLKRKYHHIRLTASARADIAWWNNYVHVFNGTVRFLHNTPVPAASFTSDACTIGGAAAFHRDWFYVNWELDYPDLAQEHINILELMTIIVAVKRWAHVFANKHIVVFTDNTCSMFAINSGTCHNAKAMSLLRELFWISAINNFHLTARHIAGCENVLSDYISRLHEKPDWPRVLQTYNLHLDNACYHMSQESFIYLQQPLHHSGRSWRKSAVVSSAVPMQIPQSLRTHL